MNIVALHAGNPGALTGGGNWTYVLPGAAPVLFDAGVGRAAHLSALAAAAADGPARVIVSHAHADHASGAPALAARWPRIAFGKLPWPPHDDPAVPWQPVGDGDCIDTGEGPWQVLHTPGHAPDHVVLWHAASRTLLAADLLQLGNTIGIPARHGGDLSAYLRSLRRVQALAPARALPAHGPAIEDPQALIGQYLAHRQQRELQVLAALEARVDRVERITDRIYAGLPPDLLAFARENVLAHLVKLEQDGLARQDGERWMLAP